MFSRRWRDLRSESFAGPTRTRLGRSGRTCSFMRVRCFSHAARMQTASPVCMHSNACSCKTGAHAAQLVLRRQSVHGNEIGAGINVAASVCRRQVADDAVGPLGIRTRFCHRTHGQVAQQSWPEAIVAAAPVSSGPDAVAKLVETVERTQRDDPVSDARLQPRHPRQPSSQLVVGACVDVDTGSQRGGRT